MAAVPTAPTAPYITLNDILGAPNLCGVLELTKSGLVSPLPAEFLTPNRKVLGDTALFKQYTGQRQTARMTPRNAPSQNNQLKELGQKDLVLITSRENIVLDVDDYQNLLKYEDLSVQDMGIQEIGRQINQARARTDNLRIMAAMSVLFTGNIYFDASGNLLPNSTNAATTVTFNVPSGNQGQLNVFGNGNIMNIDWSSSSANILQQVTNLKKAAIQLTGYPIRHAFYGSNIMGFLSNDTSTQNFLGRSAAADLAAPGRQVLATGEIPTSLWGIQWHPAYESYYLDQNNVVQTFVGDSEVVFTPDYNPNWWQFIEGTTVVPNRLGAVVNPDGSIARDNAMQTRGRWAYGTVLDDPVTAKIQYGDVFIPGLVVPSTIFQATVSSNS